MNILILKQLGLSEKEISVYLNLLEYGALSVRGLAELTKLNRGTVYDILKDLQTKKLVDYYNDKTKKKFAALGLESLSKVLANQEEQLNKLKEDIKDLVPQLKALQDKKDSKPVSKLYEGFGGIKEILDDVLFSMMESEEKHYFVYSATNSSEDINSAYPKFNEERVRNRVYVKAISLASGGGLHGLDERKWLGTEDRTATFILIYAGKCAFISRDKRDEPVGVIIENQLIYETQKMVFLRLWDFLK